MGINGQNLWLGGSDSVNEGDWKWITGENWDYTNWALERGQPDDYAEGQDYLVFHSNSPSKWDDQGLPYEDTESSFICEWPGLIAYYKLDGDARDSSGNQNDGIQNGDISYCEGIDNKAGCFDGIDDYIFLGQTGVLKFISVSLWINTTTTEVGFERENINWSGLHIIRARLYGYGIKLNPTVMGVFQEGKLLFSIHTSANSYIEYLSDEKYNDGKWHHLAFTFDNTAYKVYIDGNLKYSKELSSNGIYYTSTSVAIGRDGTSSGNYFDGAIDDVRIFNRALSQNEIRQVYSSNSDSANNRVPTATLPVPTARDLPGAVTNVPYATVITATGLPPGLRLPITAF